MLNNTQQDSSNSDNEELLGFKGNLTNNTITDSNKVEDDLDDIDQGTILLSPNSNQSVNGFHTPTSIGNEEDDDNHPLIDTDKDISPQSVNNTAIEMEDIQVSIKPKELDDGPPPKLSREMWMRIFIIYSAVLSDGLSLTLVQPFLPALLINKWGFNVENVGTVSGVLIGCYSLARFFSGFYLGHFSDKYGRKPFLVLSLLSTGIGTLVFAFLPNVWLALLIRFVEGMFSNTTALCQATLSDLVDKRNRATVFAYLGGTFALSRCLSSSLGGFLVKWFENTPNPYIYPCIIGGIIVLLSGTLIFFLHPETHPKYTTLELVHVSTKLNGDGEKVNADMTFKEGMLEIIHNKALIILLVVGGLNSYNNGGLLLGIVLFTNHPLSEHGLGFGPMKTGIVFTILGFAGFAFQIIFFKKMSLWIGLKRQYILGMTLLCIGIALFPLTYVGFLMQGEALVWVITFFVITIISIGFMQGLPIVQGMVANIAHPSIQGLTQGCGQSLNSFLRAFGPAISGVVFSFSAKHVIPWLLFVVLSVIYIIIAIVSLWIPESVDLNRKQKPKNQLKMKILNDRDDEESSTSSS